MPTTCSTGWSMSWAGARSSPPPVPRARPAAGGPGATVEPFTVEAARRRSVTAPPCRGRHRSIVLDSQWPAASARCRRALCVVQVAALHPTPADVLRHLGDPGGGLPPSLVLVTGPSRTGDIEQLLTLGAHGPTALHVVLVLDGPGPASTRDGGARA